MILRPPTLLLVLLLFGIGVIVFGQTPQNTQEPARLPTAKAKEARKLFKQNCIKCHGADGAGETAFGQVVGAADFTDSAWQQTVDDQRLVDSMTHGRGQMPSFGKKLGKEQIASLLVFVRAFQR